MGQKKYFGTDGIRGCFGKFPIMPEFARKLGWAAGKVLSEQHCATVVIGKDTRSSCDVLEVALSEGLSLAGMTTYLLGVLPTPGVAYLTKYHAAKAGIVISASHNAYHDNGIKFFSSEGQKLSDEEELVIEALLDQEIPSGIQPLGKIISVADSASKEYIRFCKDTLNIDLSQMKLIIDCANGATYQIAPKVFADLGAEVIAINVEPNGRNINEACGSTHPDSLREYVTKEKADAGIAFDGDGDRLIMVDHCGDVVDGDELLFVIAKRCVANHSLGGGVVGTVMSNLGLEQALQKLSIPFKRSKVGDRYVLEELKKSGWLLGGESSGHIIHLGLSTTGDAMISVLQVLAMMQKMQKSLHELKSAMQKFPQVLLNVTVLEHDSLLNHPRILSAVEEAEKKLGNSGRVLLRYSGTEPVIRVMVEGPDAIQVNNLTHMLVDRIKLLTSIKS